MTDEKPKDTPRAPHIHIQLDDETACGQYINMAMINHTETEFIFDMIFMQPQQNRAKVRSRLLMNPRHAKRLSLALIQNLQNYEKKFGEIPLPQLKTAAGDDVLN